MDGLKAGIVFMEYEYRNDFSQYLREEKVDIDYVMIVFLNRNYVSLRQIKDNIDVSKIAVKHGGKGHIAAAAFNMDESFKEKIIQFLLSNNELQFAK